jgi:thiamine biosynthesis lipoprotein
MNVWYRDGFFMGTRFNLLIPELDELQGKMLFTLIVSELTRLEKMLSVFDPESLVSKINGMAYEQPVSVSEELLKILLDCQAHYNKTHGLFDVGIGSLMKKLNQTGSLTPENKERKLNVSGINKVEIDQHAKTVRFVDSGVYLDFGGFGKGYALEKVVEILKDHFVRNAFISFGESSVYGLGKHPFGDHWPVAIPDLFKKQQPVKSLTLKNRAVSTSANVLRKHILDPSTGVVVEKKRSVTVKSASAVDAEVLSTAMIVAGDDEFEMLSKAYDVDLVAVVDYSNGYGNIIFDDVKAVGILE